MTVPKPCVNPPSRQNPIGMGKSTTHDAHDGDDDELQRFSKGVAAPNLEMIDAVMGREYGVLKSDKERCRSGTQSAFFFPRISCCSSGLPSRSALGGPYSRGTSS
jgi:hypothetical protein